MYKAQMIADLVGYFIHMHIYKQLYELCPKSKK